jgi:hypothetical protein
MKNGKTIELRDVHDELSTTNKLLILGMVRNGVKQKDVASAIGVSESALSRMFPSGLLRSISLKAQ